MSEEREKYLKIYRDYFNTNMMCPYCDEKGDPHREDCFLLDIIAYIEEGVPLPVAQPAPSAPAPTVVEVPTYAELEAQLRKVTAQNKMYKHSAELHEEQYKQARDNATLIRRALMQHAPQAWAEVASQLNGNMNEYDKLTSDATRGRLALAERDAAQALAATNAGLLDNAQHELAQVRGELAAGTRELRAYVEGNGFKWIEDESVVFNVTTAIGWMGGTIEALKASTLPTGGGE